MSPFRDLPDALETQEGGTGRRPTLSLLRISQPLSGRAILAKGALHRLVASKLREPEARAIGSAYVSSPARDLTAFGYGW